MADDLLITTNDTPRTPGDGWTMVNGTLMRDGEAQKIFDAARDYRVGQMSQALANTPQIDTPAARLGVQFRDDNAGPIGSFTDGLIDAGDTKFNAFPFLGVDFQVPNGIVSMDLGNLSTTDTQNQGNGLNAMQGDFALNAGGVFKY